MIKGRGKADYLELGSYNVVCFECGMKFKASVMRRNWQGYWVCPPHWEPRNVQDFVKGIPDFQTPPWVQPRPADVFVDVPDFLVQESFTLIGDDLFAAEQFFSILTESGLPLITE